MAGATKEALSSTMEAEIALCNEHQEEEEEDDEGNKGVQSMGEVVSSAIYRDEAGSAPQSQTSVDAVGSTDDNSTEPILKRKRPFCLDGGQSVHVTYKCLTRESRKNLQEVLRGWVEWQNQLTNSTNDTNGELLESGTELYFPGLEVGLDESHILPVWMDLPATKQAGYEQQPGEILLAGSQDREVEVPLYDRACNSALLSHDFGLQLEQPFEVTEEASRCFNCGAYSHGLKDCPRPRDNVAINAARKLYNSRKGSTPVSRGPSRYYQSSLGGKFDDLKPGVLGAETRQSLGIGELDPPPWLNRMRELGYPPGYLDGGDEEPSGITIFDGEEEYGEKNATEDGEIIDIRPPATNGSWGKRMIVGFPGLNAPIPKDADENLWKSSPELKHSSGGRDMMHHLVTKNSLQHSNRRSSNRKDSPSDLFHPHGLQAESHLSSKNSPILHRSLSDNSRRGRSSDFEDSSPVSRELYQSPAGNSPFARHDGLLSHPPSLLPPRSPSLYSHSPNQHTPSSWHTYGNSRERTFLRPHMHTPKASSPHSQRHDSSFHPRGRNKY